MTNLDRWKPLAQNVMSELALPDDPQRLVVIATALAGAAQAERDELEWQVADIRNYRDIAETALEEAVKDCKVPEGYNAAQIMRLIAMTRTQAKRIAELERAALSDDGARAGK